MPSDDQDAVEADLPEAYLPDWTALESATSEDPFMTAGVELFKEAAVLASLSAGVLYGRPLNRDAAIRCGLMTRAARLARTTLRDTCVGNGEQQMALSRQLMDTVMALIYLVEDEDGSRHTAYVQHSLVTERELLKDIAGEQHRTGESHPIEDRMRHSIARLAAAGGVDPSELPGRSKISWPSAERLAQDLGSTAYGAYRMGSAALHGTWSDLHRNYLDEVDGGFKPRFDPVRPRPQPLLAGTILLVGAIAAYLSTQHEQVRRFIGPRLPDLGTRVERADTLHEQFLQRNADETV